MRSETIQKTLHYAQVVSSAIYKLLVLAALAWIGYGVQSIAVSLNAPVEDSCTADQSSDEQGSQDNQPQIIKPMLRGQM